MNISYELTLTTDIVVFVNASTLVRHRCVAETWETKMWSTLSVTLQHKYVNVHKVCATYFCFEIEHRHTFTRSKDEIQVPGYWGRVWVPKIDTAQLKSFRKRHKICQCLVKNYVMILVLQKPVIVANGCSFQPILQINNIFPGLTLLSCQTTTPLLWLMCTITWAQRPPLSTGMAYTRWTLYGWMDGVEHITQCGIAPSSSFRYIFWAHPPGTHWYHGRQ